LRPDRRPEIQGSSLILIGRHSVAPEEVTHRAPFFGTTWEGQGQSSVAI